MYFGMWLILKTRYLTRALSWDYDQILIVVTKMESVAGALPDVGYHIWLLDFQLGCLVRLLCL